jgi:hypothetical protein
MQALLQDILTRSANDTHLTLSRRETLARCIENGNSP